MQRGLHVNVPLGGDVAGDHEHAPQRCGDFLHRLATARLRYLFKDPFAGFGVELRFFQRFDKSRAEIAQGQRLSLVLNVARVRQGENRLAAIPFDAGNGGDGACGRYGELRGVADAVSAYPIGDRLPCDGRAAPVAAWAFAKPGGPGRRLPGERFGIVAAAANGGERPPHLC